MQCRTAIRVPCKDQADAAFRRPHHVGVVMTRSVPLLLALSACSSPPIESAVDTVVSPIVTQSPDDLGRVLSIAQACMIANSPGISLMPHESIAGAGDGLWEVRIRDQDQIVHTAVVDAERGACGDLVVTTALGPPLGSLSVLMDQAWQCGQELGGTGVGDTPLVREGMTLHSNKGARIAFSISETERRTAPTGLDLTAGNRCGRLPMD